MATPNEKGRSSGKSATPRTTRAQHSGNSTDAQRARLLEALHERAMTTLEIRSQLDILSPASRVIELRRQGKNITTVRVDRQTDAGRTHRVALYVLALERDLFSDAPTDDNTTH